MTIIVLRAGVMAGDSATWHDNTIRMLARKIVRAPDGTLVGAAGNAHMTARFRAWVAAGMTDDFTIDAEDGDFEGLIAFPDGRVERVEHDGSRWLQDPETPFHILGCAGELALGALAMGATAEEAVGICIEHHSHCAGPVQVERMAHKIHAQP